MLEDYVEIHGPFSILHGLPVECFYRQSESIKVIRVQNIFVRVYLRQYVVDSLTFMEELVYLHQQFFQKECQETGT